MLKMIDACNAFWGTIGMEAPASFQILMLLIQDNIFGIFIQNINGLWRYIK
jgi:hypothetical protein